MGYTPLLTSLALAGSLIASSPHRVEEPSNKPIEMTAVKKAMVRAAWFRDHLRCEVRPLSKDEARSYTKMQGAEPYSSLISTSFMRQIRWPAENGSLTDTWNQPINMINSTAYIRDVLVGAHFFLTAAADGDSWNMNFHMPDGSTVSLDTPVTFHVNGYSGCWSGPWPTVCD